MKRFHRWALWIVMLLGLLMLSGCQHFKKEIKTETTLTIDSRFKGKREMVTTIPSSVVKDSFNGDVENLRQSLTEHIPEQMTFELTDNQDNVVVTFTIESNDYEDYFGKISAILGIDTEDDKSTGPVIKFDAGDSILKSGYSISENFNSVELLSWFEKLTQADGVVASLKNPVMTETLTQVNYNGEVKSSDSPIEVSNMTSKTFDAIEATVDFKDTDLYQISVDYMISRATQKSLGTALDTMMKEIVPENAQMTVNDENNQRVYTIAMEPMSAANNVKALNTMFKTKDTVFSVESTGDDQDMLKAQQNIVLYINAGYFLDYSKTDSYFSYVLKTDAQYAFAQCDSKHQYIISKEYDQTDEASMAYIRVAPSDQITVNLSYNVDIDAISVSTTIVSGSEITRTVTFDLADDVDTLVGKAFEEKIQSRLQEGVSYEKTSDNGRQHYIVTITGNSADKISERTSILLDQSSEDEEMIYTATLSGGVPSSKELRYKRYEYVDTMDFTNFLNGSIVLNGIHYEIVYPEKYTAHMEDQNNYDDVVMEANKISCMTYNRSISMETNATRTNYTGIRQLIFLGVSLIGMVVILILNAKYIMHCVVMKKLDFEYCQLFTKKGYTMMTTLLFFIILFVLSCIRLLFKVY